MRGGSHSSAHHNPTPSGNATEVLLPRSSLGVGKGQGVLGGFPVQQVLLFGVGGQMLTPCELSNYG